MDERRYWRPETDLLEFLKFRFVSDAVVAEDMVLYKRKDENQG